MRFHEPLYSKIPTGEKTQTRRPVKPNEEILRRWISSSEGFGNYGVLQWRYCDDDVRSYIKWQVGRTYAVQTGRQKAGGRILLKAIRRERLWDITDLDLEAEGFVDPLCRSADTRMEFFAYWDKLYRKQPALQSRNNPPVWVLEFELVRAGPRGGEGWIGNP